MGRPVGLAFIAAFTMVSALAGSPANADQRTPSLDDVLIRVQACLEATKTDRLDLSKLMPNASAEEVTKASLETGQRFYLIQDTAVKVIVYGPIERDDFCIVNADDDGTIGRYFRVVMKRDFGSDPVDTPLGDKIYPAWKLKGQEIFVRETVGYVFIEIYVRHSQGKSQ